MNRSGMLTRLAVTGATALVLFAACAVPASAATVKLNSASRKRLGSFMTAFTTEQLSTFSRKKGPSDAKLVQFAVWHIYHYGKNGDVKFSGSHGLVKASLVDSVSRRYFGRAPKRRSSHSSVAVTYSGGMYRFMPGDGEEYYRAATGKVTSSKGRTWTVHLDGMEHYEELDAGPVRVHASYVGTLKLSGSHKTPHFKLTAWKVTKVRVPSVIGMYPNHGADDLLHLFELKVKKVFIHGPLDPDAMDSAYGTVYRQTPKFNTLVPTGTTVEVRSWWENS